MGFLWFGTQDGMQRYNGYSFREFRHDPKNPNSLSGSDSFALLRRPLRKAVGRVR